MKIGRIAIAVVVLACVAWAAYWFRFVDPGGMSLRPGKAAEPAYLTANAEDLNETIVTPCLDQRMVGGKNVIWCASFQLAWNKLSDLENGSAKGVQTVRRGRSSSAVDSLNRRLVTEKDVPKDCYVADAGLGGRALVGSIRRELRQKFHGQEAPKLLQDAERAKGPVAYAYMYRDLPFKWAFQRRGDALQFEGLPVDGFGILQCEPGHDSATARMWEQVSILDHRNDDDFVIELKTLQVGDRLILAKVRPGATLEQTVRAVQKRMLNTKPTSMEGASSLAVPVIDFDILADYSEGSRGASSLRVAETALQSVRFRLDETGAVLRSESCLAKGIIDIPMRNLIFDKPFLIMLQRRGAKNPYLAIWVANPEILM